MTKGWLLFLFIILFLIGTFFGYFMALKKRDTINITPSQVSTNEIDKTTSWSQVTTNESLILNSVEQLVENFLSIKDESQISELMKNDYLSSYILTTQKILQEWKILTEQKRKQIDEHTDIFIDLLYIALQKDEKNKAYVESFKTSKDFVLYFRESVFTGKALGKDMDVSETIANNRSYCQDNTAFPTQKDKNACIAQMDFFHANSLNDCTGIDKTIFPGWREICDDYFTMMKQ